MNFSLNSENLMYFLLILGNQGQRGSMGGAVGGDDGWNTVSSKQMRPQLDLMKFRLPKVTLSEFLKVLFYLSFLLSSIPCTHMQHILLLKNNLLFLFSKRLIIVCSLGQVVVIGHVVAAVALRVLKNLNGLLVTGEKIFLI